MFEVGKSYSISQLKKTYDAYFATVLRDCLKEERQEMKGNYRPPRRYVITAEMPDQAEYQRLKQLRYTTTVADLYGDVTSELESLASEMQEWFDNLSKGLQQTDRGQRVEAAADLLGNIMLPDPPPCTAVLELTYFPLLSVTSRADRAGECSSMLLVIAMRVQEFLDDNRDKAEDVWEFEGVTVDVSALEDFATECESASSELGEVDFPGTFD